MLAYITHQTITILIITFLVLSILYQIIIGLLYQNMMKEAENMSSTTNKLLNQCKLQFSTSYQLQNGNINTLIYVERFLSKMKIAKIRIGSLFHISGQLMLLSIFFAGIGICKSIAEGLSTTEIVPYYFISFLSLYLYFSVSSFVDISGKKELLKITIVDFFENRMMNRLNYNMTDVVAKKEWNQLSNVSHTKESKSATREEKEESEVITVVEQNTPVIQEDIKELASMTTEEELVLLLQELFA